jgi:hypothetical protein
MSAKSELLQWQKRWAEARGLSPDNKGYLPELESNLLRPLSASAKSAFNEGSGSELLDGPTRPAKMKALHSSSALAVNFFDSWVSRDRKPLVHALGIDRDILDIQFERQYPTGLPGNPPNLDIALELEGGVTIAIESKFSEWLTPKSTNKESFKSKYFSSDDGLWAKRGLVASEELARRIHTGDTLFEYLDAPQLLKHALGLVTQVGRRFCLWYVYLAWPGRESDLHSTEFELFSQFAGDELAFRSLTYQELLVEFRRQPGVDLDYLEYLEGRYCDFGVRSEGNQKVV